MEAKKTNTNFKYAFKSEADQILGELKTQSGVELKNAYTVDDIADLDLQKELSLPGHFPFTRGAYPEMYRRKLWMRGVVAGQFFKEEICNQVMKDYFERGVLSSGMRLAPDYCNNPCVDPDHPMVKYDIGRGGVPHFCVDSLAKSFQDISLIGGAIEIAPATGPPDVNFICMLVALAEIRGEDTSQLRLVAVNDPLHTHIYGCQDWQPLDLGFKLTIDSIEYCARRLPKCRPTNGGCGYDMRESGINSVQELAFVFANKIAYIDATLERGLKFEEFAYRMPLAFAAEMDFFENVCKMRVARKIFASLAVERYGQDPATVKCPPCNYNFAGSAMTKEQPILNVIRNTSMAISAVLAGVNGMEVTTYGEAEGIPPIEGWVVNRGIENVVAQETGVAYVADPLGGSYYVEWLTQKLEREARNMLGEILEMGGTVKAIKKGWFRDQVERAARERQKELEGQIRIKVGVNAFQEMNEPEIKLPKMKQPPIDPETFLLETQKEILKEVTEYKQKRDFDVLNKALSKLYHKAKAEENVIREMIDAYKVKATISEVMGVIREASGYEYDVFKMIRRPPYLCYT